MRVCHSSHDRAHSFALCVACCTLIAAISSPSGASAATLNPGDTLVASGEPDPIGGAVIDSLSSPLNAATFTGTLVSKVISGDTSNPLGGLTFTYQITNFGASPHSIERLTLNNFGFTLTDASYQTPLVGTNVAPSTINRSVGPDGDAIGFSFIPHIGPPVNFGNGDILPGRTSALLVIQTNWPTYQRSQAFVIDGSTAMATTFSPIPEPSSVVLASMGLVGLVATAWRRRRRA